MRVICTATKDSKGRCPARYTFEPQGCRLLDCPYYTRISEPIEVQDVDWREKCEVASEVADDFCDALSRQIEETMERDTLIASLIAAFEELAGEHRYSLGFISILKASAGEWVERAKELEARCDRQATEIGDGNALLCPGPGWYWVKGHWRSRTAPEARASQAPTGDKDGEPGESPASLQGQGDWLQDNPEAAELVRQGLEDCAEGRVSEVPSEVFRDGVTVWYCELCGKPTDRYPCKCETVPTSDDVVTGSPAVCRWEVGRWGV